MILANLTSKQGGLVVSRNKVDFDKFYSVPDIHDEVDIDQKLVDRAAPIEFARILQESIFSLCPSGFGPNSMRLWESIGWGSIPVVLSGNYLPPGSSALWEEATVSCPERLEDILALPDRLEALARDEALLERKRHALRQLWMLYGLIVSFTIFRNCFYHLLRNILIIKPSHDLIFPMVDCSQWLQRSIIERSVHDNEFDAFILGCSSRVLSDPSGFLNCYEENAEFRMAYKAAISSCNRAVF